MMTRGAATGCADAGERLLVARCLTGDQAAWEAFVDAHYCAIVSVVSWKKWRFDTQEIEDVTQEVMAEIVKALKTFEFKSNLGTFVYRIAVNTCGGNLRKKTAIKRRLYSAQVALDPIESGADRQRMEICVNPGRNQEEALLEQEELFSLKKALFKLDEQCKNLIRQRYFSDSSFEEISRRTGIKTNTLVVQLKRCLARLLTVLKEKY